MTGPLVVSSREALAEAMAALPGGHFIRTGTRGHAWDCNCGKWSGDSSIDHPGGPGSFLAHKSEALADALLASGALVTVAEAVKVWPCYRTGLVRYDTCLTRNAAAHESAMCERCAALADGQAES